MITNRREFLRTSARLTGAAVLAPSLQGLIACAGNAVGLTRMTSPEPAARGAGGYGPLRVAGPELALPEGFSYSVVSFSGKPMSDGRLTPGAFDGMGAFRLPNGNVRLIRNHENRDPAVNAQVKGDPARAYDSRGGGGTTSLEIEVAANGSATLVRDFISLGGTVVNCAGGPTPWGTWLTCEENMEGRANGRAEEHGYVFEVPATAEQQVTSVPLKAMGRFVHEAVAVDPRTDIVYETEDRGTAGFYRFLPRERRVLSAGGVLEMLAVDGRLNYDTATGQQMGSTRPVSWVRIDNPDPAPMAGDLSAVFAQGFAKGAARFSRLEGCWWGDGGVFFHATDGGDARVGQVWFYEPRGADRGELTLVFESPSADLLDAPDNVTVSPRGGIVLCEDGAGEQFVRGLTREGRIFDFARNLVNTGEFAGACFSPAGRTLFLNIQGSTLDAGAERSFTFAIHGPWEDGAL